MNRSVSRALRVGAIVTLAAGVGAAAATFLIRDQITRHRRNLFSPLAFRRLAALQHMAGAAATVDDVLLLRDFISWEPRSLLRGRAQAILKRMEAEAAGARKAENEARSRESRG